MRTIKRTSVDLNKNKQDKLSTIAIAYSKEKQYWLNFFQKKENLMFIKQPRKIRDQYVQSKYKSPYGLQARMWKLALEDASDLMDKYWQSIFVEIKRNIYQNKNFSDLQRHCAYWLLKLPNGLDIILNNKTIEFKSLTQAEIKVVIKYLNKQITKKQKSNPKIKLHRSFNLDANCYSIFTHNGKQYISIMTLTPGKRLVIPLLGNTVITGNIKIIIDNNIAMVHYSANLKSRDKDIKDINNNVIAVDFGYSEVITDNLSSNFIFTKTKNWNRRLSSWIRGKLQDRLEFKALAKGFSHKQVNPAYSSQTCPNCEYVDRKNRNGDKFKCQHCGYVSHADWVAAQNHRNRYFDLEITRYMPYCEVKQILLRRFHRRLETENRALLAAGL